MGIEIFALCNFIRSLDLGAYKKDLKNNRKEEHSISKTHRKSFY